MKLLILSLLSLSALAAPVDPKLKTVIDKVEKMEWDGKKYTVSFGNFQKTFTLTSDSPSIPCLENARRSNMAVLLRVDPAIPHIRECKLYSDSFPITPGYIEDSAQAQEASPQKILKR